MRRAVVVNDVNVYPLSPSFRSRPRGGVSLGYCAHFQGGFFEIFRGVTVGVPAVPGVPYESEPKPGEAF